MAAEPGSLPSPRSEDDCPPPHAVQNQQLAQMTPHQAQSANQYDVEDSPGVEDFTRPYDAPRNQEGKIICMRDGCAGITFERRCEWSKHMDKHERPYECKEPGCEKLRGFTYSGGLLRHQREVHKQHGGPKELLVCPVPFCKRNIGGGFTRKENLNEHIRRVHRHVEGVGATSPSAPLLDAAKAAAAASAANPLEALVASGPGPSPTQPPLVTTPFDTSALAPELGGTATPPPAKARKRKARSTPQETYQNHAELHSLRHEVEQLRRDNDEKDARISRLEAMVQGALPGVQQHEQMPTAQMQQ